MNKRKTTLALVASLILCVILLVAMLWANREVISDYLEASGIDVEDYIPEPLRPPTPGPSPTPGLDTYIVTPWPEWSERKQEELDQRAQVLYDRAGASVKYEIANPLFKRMFPRAHMYAVRWPTSGSSDHYATMVSLGDKDYEMPYQFNQLMFDAGYELNEETRDSLAHAFIVASLLIPEAPVTCDEGEEIYEESKTGLVPPLVYEVHCHTVYGRVVDARTLTIEYIDADIVVKFDEFTDQFRDTHVVFVDKHGNKLFGYSFGSGWTMPEEE